MSKLRSLAWLVGGSLLSAASVHAQEAPETPHHVLSSLSDRLYAIGETSGSLASMLYEERAAAAKIAQFIAAGGDRAALTEKNGAGQTPLMVAAFHGFPDVAEALLQTREARADLETANPRNWTAWTYASLAFYRSFWACHPEALPNPFAWVPIMVKQPYYQMKWADEPYQRTRALLEKAGAKADMALARRAWQETCARQQAATRARVEKEEDVLPAVQAEGDRVWMEIQQSMQEKQRR